MFLPQSETLDDEHTVIRMRNGYKVAVHVSRVASIESFGYKEAVYGTPERRFQFRPDLPRAALPGTGGTVASQLDCRAGAVIPAFVPGELCGSVPELVDTCNLATRKLFGVFSQNMPGSSTSPLPAPSTTRSRKERTAL